TSLLSEPTMIQESSPTPFAKGPTQFGCACAPANDSSASRILATSFAGLPTSGRTSELVTTESLRAAAASGSPALGEFQTPSPYRDSKNRYSRMRRLASHAVCTDECAASRAAANRLRQSAINCSRVDIGLSRMVREPTCSLPFR